MVNVLFVCTGNTCRSPMAEAILKSKGIPHVEVKSAGVFASPGQSASKHTTTVLKENQIDFEHSSQMLSEELVHWADYILTMTGQHKDVILSYYPEVSQKLFTLKGFAEKSGDVSDPYGGSVQDYQETYRELAPLIERLVEKVSKGE